MIQGPKLRAIDDMSASMINATVGSHEKLQFYDIPVFWQWREFCNASVHGRSFDMQNAYRQIPVLPAHRRLSYVAHFCPSAGRPLAFAMNCMPFHRSFGWSSFSDVALTSVSEKVIRTVFHVLGFVLSTNPKKDHPFAETFTALGIEFLLHDTPTSLAVRNTAARCEELLALLREILHSDCVTARQLQSLRSRLHFAEAHMYGRVGVCMIKQMSVVEGFTQTSPLPPALRVSNQAMIHRLQHNPPVEVPMLQKEPWHVFTDGAQAVVISPDGRCRACWGLALGTEVMALWPPWHILHAELLPVLVALAAWGEHLRNQPVFFHIDSEAAKHSLIRGTCQQREAQFLVSAVLHLETQLCLRPWYSRIPSESNPADAPSRLAFSGLTQQGFDHQAVSNDSVLALVQAARGR